MFSCHCNVHQFSHSFGPILEFLLSCSRDCLGTPFCVQQSYTTLWEGSFFWISLCCRVERSRTRWLKSLRKKKAIPTASSLRTLHPFFDNLGVLRVGGRLTNSQIAYSQRHLVILSGQHPLTKLIIRAGHVRLFHAGPTLVSFSLRRRFHIIRIRNAVLSITRACVVCRRTSARPQPQIMGQLPLERITPGIVFENVGIDYAGPVYLKLG